MDGAEIGFLGSFPFRFQSSLQTGQRCGFTRKACLDGTRSFQLAAYIISAFFNSISCQSVNLSRKGRKPFGDLRALRGGGAGSIFGPLQFCLGRSHVRGIRCNLRQSRIGICQRGTGL